MSGQRWVPSRKAELILAIRDGTISLAEACQRHALAPEEFRAWEAAFDAHGVAGLRVTRLQIYRDPMDPRQRRR